MTEKEILVRCLLNIILQAITTGSSKRGDGGVGGHHFQQTGQQPGMVTNPPCGQLNRENRIFIFPVPVRA